MEVFRKTQNSNVTWTEGPSTIYINEDKQEVEEQTAICQKHQRRLQND